MSKSFRQFKKGDFGLREAKASTTHLQYLRAKQAGNQHFEVRRYIADKILNDRKLAQTLKQDVKKKVLNWDEVWSTL